MGRRPQRRRTVADLANPTPHDRDTRDSQLGRSGGGCLRVLAPIPAAVACAFVLSRKAAR